MSSCDFLARRREAVDRWEFTRSRRSWVFWRVGMEALADRLDERERHALRSNVDGLIRDSDEALSLPLLTNLALWLCAKLGTSCVARPHAPPVAPGPEHFYTISESERDQALLRDGYADERVACYVHTRQIEGTTPLYRLRRIADDEHFYTVSARERAGLLDRAEYADEGVAGYVFRVGGSERRPWYRLYNARSGDHLYTIATHERDQVIAKHGYVEEGIAGFVHDSPNTGAVPLYRLWRKA